MALSFEESKKQLLAQQAVARRFSLRSVSGEDWIPHDKYTWIHNYHDDKVSTIDSDKNIFVLSTQVNISQEVNSQFFPFEMMRRYDNIDLSNMAISVHYTTKDGRHGSSVPINVQYNDEKIRFAWLIDEHVTRVAGEVKFEIHANGALIDSKGNTHAYRWKSRPSQFTVYESLCEGTGCEPTDVSDDWVVELVDSVASSVAESVADAVVEEIAESEVQEYVQDTVDDALTWGAFGLQNRR